MNRKVFKAFSNSHFVNCSIAYFPKYMGFEKCCHTRSQLQNIQSQTSSQIQDINKAKPTKQSLMALINIERNPDKLIKIIEPNQNDLEGLHVIVALTAMSKYFVENKYNMQDVTSDQHFSKMLDILYKHLMTLDLPQTVQAFRVLQTLQIPTSTNIFQSILQLIRCSINDLELNHIYFLSSRMKQINPTHLSEAIKKALPEVFKAQVKFQIDRDNIDELTNALVYLSREKIKDVEIAQYVMQGFYKNKQEIGPLNAKRIYLALINMDDLPDGYFTLLQKAEDVIMKNLNFYNFNTKNLLLQKLVKKFQQGNEDFYNLLLMDTLINGIVLDKPDFQSSMLHLNALNKINYFNISLLEYVSSEALHNEHLLKSNPFIISTLAFAMSLANFKSQKWEELITILKKYSCHLDDPSLSYFTLHLASLNHFDEDLIRKVFSIKQIVEYLSPHYHNVLKELYQSVKALYPEYAGSWPQNDLIQSFQSIKMNNELKTNSLLPALSQLFNGCVFTNLITLSDHSIDYLMFSQDNEPIKTFPSFEHSCEIKLVEDLPIPANSKSVIIQFLPPSTHARNSVTSNGRTLLSIKTLETLFDKVVPISQDQWDKIPDGERIPYLQYLLGLKTKTKKSSM